MDSEFYIQARREWDERDGDLVLGKRNWHIAESWINFRLPKRIRMRQSWPNDLRAPIPQPLNY